MSTLMTIGDFARRTALSVSALRFYDRRGILVPANVVDSSGYRLYAEDQVEPAIMIRDLRLLNMSLRDVERVLGLGAADRADVIAEHLARLERTVDRAHAIAQTLGVQKTKETKTMSTKTRPPTATLTARPLAQALRQVLPSAGVDPEAPHLMGVLIESKDGSLRLAATDRFRLAIRDVVPDAVSGDFSVVVPAASLSGWPEGLGDASTVEIAVADDALTLSGADSQLTSPVVPLDFPDYERYLEPVADAVTITVDQATLLAAIQHLSRDEVTLTASADHVVLAQDEIRREVAAACSVAGCEFNIDAGYLRDAIVHAIGPEIVIEVGVPHAAVMFRSADDGTYVSLVMPIEHD